MAEKGPYQMGKFFFAGPLVGTLRGVAICPHPWASSSLKGGKNNTFSFSQVRTYTWMHLDLCDCLDDYPDFKGFCRSGMHKTYCR